MRLIDLVKEVLQTGRDKSHPINSTAIAVLHVIREQVLDSLDHSSETKIEKETSKPTISVRPWPQVRNTVPVNFAGGTFRCPECASPYFQPGTAEDKLEHARNVRCPFSAVIIENPNFNIQAYVVEERD